MPRGCADKFEEISAGLQRLSTVAEDVKVLRAAVIGNGKPEKSLLSRVKDLEGYHERMNSSRRRWLDRLWKAGLGAALVAFGVWLKS